jgi:hypothetical protein
METPTLEPPLIKLFTNQKTKRYYNIYLQLNLFEEWEVLTVWGSNNSNAGRIVVKPCGSWGDGIKLVEQLSKRRLKRGYIERQ